MKEAKRQTNKQEDKKELETKLADLENQLADLEDQLAKQRNRSWQETKTITVKTQQFKRKRKQVDEKQLEEIEPGNENQDHPKQIKNTRNNRTTANK